MGFTDRKTYRSRWTFALALFAVCIAIVTVVPGVGLARIIFDDQETSPAADRVDSMAQSVIDEGLVSQDEEADGGETAVEVSGEGVSVRSGESEVEVAPATDESGDTVKVESGDSSVVVSGNQVTISSDQDVSITVGNGAPPEGSPWFPPFPTFPPLPTMPPFPTVVPAPEGPAAAEGTFELCGVSDPQTEEAIAQLIDGRSFSARLKSRQDGCAELTIAVSSRAGSSMMGRQSTNMSVSVGGAQGTPSRRISIQIVTENGITRATIGAGN